MKLKYKWHSYSDVSDHEVEVPDDIVFIHDPNDVGNYRYGGFGHYLGGSATTIGDFNRDFGVMLYKDFPGLSLFSFTNVVFKSEIKVIPWQEFFDKFDIGSYYIFKYTEDKAVPVHGPTTSEDSSIKSFSFKMIPGRLISVSKILKMRTQHLIDLMTCSVNSWIDALDDEVKTISLNKNISLMEICDGFRIRTEIRKNCDKDFTEALNQVLGIVGKQAID